MTTQVMTQDLVSLDISILKTEIFDIDMANQLLREREISNEDHKKLQKYYKKRNGAGREVDVHYILKTKTNDEFLGRLYPKNHVGLQTLPRDIRNALAQKYYWDIDFENAQPTLLLQYAAKNGWEHTYLKQFVENREKTLKETQELLKISRKEAKDRYIQLFFGSTYYDGLPLWIAKSLAPELTKIKDNIYLSHSDLAKKMKHNKNSVMSFVLQTIERHCIIAVDNALKVKGRQIDVILHDGGYVRKVDGEQEFPTNLLKELEHSVFTATGYRLHITQKPIETTFKYNESGFKIYDFDEVINDLFAARVFVERNKQDICYSNGSVYVFNQSTGIWSNDEDELDKKIAMEEDALVFRKHGKAGIVVYDYSGSVKNRANLKTMLVSVLDTNDEFLETGRKNACGKLLFKNGIYDFASQTLMKEFDRTIVFSSAIGRDFPEDVAQENVDFVNHTFFEAPFSNADTPRVFRHFLMRGLIGDYRMKKFLVALGDKNSSKGTMTNFCKYVFGGNATTFNANNLLLKKHQGDAEREFSWIGDICNSRLTFSNEIKNDGIKIDGNMLKTMTGGGDEIAMRNLYKTTERIYNYAMPILFAQDLPEFSPPDAINSRIVVIQYDYSFMDDPKLPNEKKADLSIKDKLCCPKYADAFVSMMIQEYNQWQDNEYAELVLPQFMIDDKDEIAPISDIRAILEEEFEITGNEDDCVPYNDISDCLKSAKITMNSTRVGRELSRIGLGKKVQKMNRKSTQMRTGIKRYGE